MLRAHLLRSVIEPAAGAAPSRAAVVATLGSIQILAWGSSYYLPAALAAPIVADTGWPLPWVVGGLSLGLVVASIVSPRVGRLVEAHGGRPVLASSSILLSAGLAGLALAPSLPLHLAAWVVIGLGMGAGLYDAAIATLGRQYGHDAMGAIVNLTLLGGFASTVCWPFSVFLDETIGWRGACLTYALLHLALALPMHLYFLPHAPQSRRTHDGHAGSHAAHRRHASLTGSARGVALALLVTIFTLASFIVGVVSVHVIAVLQARGITLEEAVSTAALIGPAQVGARIVQALLGRYVHPMWTLVASVGLMALGLAVLTAGFPFAAVPLVVYAAGVGIESIARGHMPLALFGPDGYATLIGRIAMPALLAQAAAPPLAALVFGHLGPVLLLTVLAMMAMANVALGSALMLCVRRAGLR